MTQNHKRKFYIKGMLFDMDGVITNTMPDHFRAWSQVLRNLNIHAKKHDIYTREGQKGIQSIQEMAQENSLKLKKNQLKTILAEKEIIFQNIAKRRFIPGSRSFLKKMHQKGFRLGLVTGTSLPEVKQILPEKYFKLFSVIITGDQVQHGKPAPEPYLTGLQRIGVLPHEAIVIENAPLGIESAKSAGLTCLALETSLATSFLHKADMIFKSFNEIEEKVVFHLMS